jgi:hypothetical protein
MAATIHYGEQFGEKRWVWADLKDHEALAPFTAQILAAKARIGGDADEFAQRIAREFFLT